MNNWYNRIVGAPNSQAIPQQMNSMQRAQYIMNAMMNPVAFVQEQFPDVPENIRSNPNAVLSYLSQTRGSAFINQLNRLSENKR